MVVLLYTEAKLASLHSFLLVMHESSLFVIQIYLTVNHYKCFVSQKQAHSH